MIGPSRVVRAETVVPGGIVVPRGTVVPGGMVVRLASRDDDGACTDLWTAAVAARDGADESEAVRARARGKFAAERVALVVAEDRSEADDVGALVGFALVTAPGTGSPEDPADAAYLSLLAVAPGAQGHGAGRSLLRAAVAEAARAGHDRCLLHALDDNEPALRLYRSAGFRAVGPTFPHALNGRATRAWIAGARRLDDAATPAPVTVAGRPRAPAPGPAPKPGPAPAPGSAGGPATAASPTGTTAAAAPTSPAAPAAGTAGASGS